MSILARFALHEVVFGNCNIEKTDRCGKDFKFFRARLGWVAIVFFISIFPCFCGKGGWEGRGEVD